MTHKFKIIQDWYDSGEKVYSKASAEIKDGLTVLCGCNGCGKTTLLHQIKNALEKENIPFLHFNNLLDGGNNSVSASLFRGEMDFVAQADCSSEGENINMNIGKFAQKMGALVRKNQTAKEIFFLMDAIDSGLSIDNVIDTKRQLFNLVIEDCKSKGISVYIIVSANEYELARGEQCLDTFNLKYVKFPDYEAFRDFVIKTRKAKNQRYKWEEWDEND